MILHLKKILPMLTPLEAMRILDATITGMLEELDNDAQLVLLRHLGEQAARMEAFVSGRVLQARGRPIPPRAPTNTDTGGL